MTPDVAGHLVLDSDAEFLAFVTASGTQDLRGAIAAFEHVETTRTAADHERAYRTVRPYWLRAAQALELHFGLPAYARELAHRDSLTIEERWQVRRIAVHVDSLNGVAHAGPRPEPAAVAEQLAWCEARGHWRQVQLLYAWLAEGCRARGQFAGERSYKRVQLALAQRLDDFLSSSQLAGELAVIDSTVTPERQVAIFDSLQLEARRHGLVDQVARLYAFKASVAKHQGRLVLERELRLQAVAAWDGVGSAANKGRALMELTGFFVGLDSWDEVNALCRRVEAYAPRYRQPWRARASALVALTRADGLIQEGRPADAARVLAAIDAEADVENWPVVAPALDRELALVSETLGNEREASERLARGIERCMTNQWPAGMPPLLAQAARILVRTGEPDSALRLLSWFDAKYPTMELSPAMRVELLSVRSRAESRAGDHVAASATLTRALQTLWEAAHASDAGAESYLALADPPGLREALLETSTSAPSPSYRTELALRGWVRMLGGRTRGEPTARWSWRATTLAPSLREGEAHLVFAFVGDRLCRWTATPRGVSLDTLAGDALAWRRRVSDVRESLARPGSEQRSREMLRALARELLPDRLRTDVQLRRLYWSPAGPLAALPLEALDVGAGQRYEPLGSRIEAATLRGADAGRVPAPDVAVLAAPALSETGRRLPRGLAPLDQSAAEAEDVRRWWPRALLLTGAEATETAVLESWNSAGLVHIAAHLVRLGEIPYYDFIPLAIDHTPGADATLEVADVRGRDLSRCELVVLSTCASGVPYVGRRRVGPSMADAFLDAGARAVLRSLRPVEDAEARRFVVAFLGEWRRNGRDAVAAAHAARRSLFAKDPSRDSPASWATWSVAVNVPFREVRSQLPPVAMSKPRSSHRGMP